MSRWLEWQQGKVRKVINSRRMRPSFGWRKFRYAKDGHIRLSRMKGNKSAGSVQTLIQSAIATMFAGSQPTHSYPPSEEVDFPDYTESVSPVHRDNFINACGLDDDLACPQYGCECECRRPKQSSDGQMTSSGCLGNNRI